MLAPWNLACRDWENRIRRGLSLIPTLPLNTLAADGAIAIYNNLRLPDVPGTPTLGIAGADWFREIVGASFGSIATTGDRMVREIFCLVPKKNSKAVALDTLIATPTGFVRMGDVRVGDEVLDSDGKVTVVTEKSPVFTDRPCFEVSFSTGEAVVCDAEHLWVTDAHTDRQLGEGNAPQPSVKKTADIAASLTTKSGADTIDNHRTALCGALDLPDADLPIPPYALGLSLRDGSTDGIPSAYLRGSVDQRLALLRGLMDSDGSISKAGQSSFATTLPTLRDDVRELINSLGFRASVSEQRAVLNGRDCGPVWHVGFRPSLTSKTRQIVGVKPIASVPVQCIAVASETHQYLVTRSLVPTHNTTNGAAFMMVALLLNKRPRAEFLLIGPTQAISDLAFSQAVGMIEADPSGFLQKRMHIQEHLKTITDRRTKAKLRVKTFDEDILTGPKPAGVLIDEVHLLGKKPNAIKIIGQLRGGLISNPEAFLVFITTQSDDPPAGVFKAELQKARDIRDGLLEGVPMLPILYELPPEFTKQAKPGELPAWYDSSSWWMVTPNRDKSISIDRLIADFAAARTGGEEEIRRWASQHLNIEIGMSLRSDRWTGADYWEACGDPTLTLEQIIARSEICTVGIDGGGMDDLLGFAVIGRDRDTRRLLHYGHAWAHKTVLERRKDIASRLLDFVQEGTLTLVEHVGDDVREVADIVERLEVEGLLPEKFAIGVDQIGIDEIVDEITQRGIDIARIGGVPQGYQLNNAIKTTERKLAGGVFVHGDTKLMAFCVANAKAEPRGNAISITKQVAGSGKIDPLMATLDAMVAMGKNPDAGRSVYDVLAEEEEAAKAAAEALAAAGKAPPSAISGPLTDEEQTILSNPAHPRWQEVREKFEASLDSNKAEEDF